MPNLASIETCTGCMACADICPKQALSQIINEEGHYYYQLDKSKCIECKKCEKICPAREGYIYGENSLSLSSPFAAWSTDNTLRRKSTSGGIFSSIAKSFLINGDIVVGASISNNVVEHRCIDNINDLNILQGSKYAQSDTNGVYNQIKNYLATGKKVLFSGTGCQVAAVLEFFKNNPYKNNLFTIDLICGGVPTTFLISKYIDWYNDYHFEISGFRNKSKYEFSVIDKDGNTRVIPLSGRPLPLCGFYTELTNRKICYDCKYALAHRMSDLTIGDLWGDTQYMEQHKDGLSVVVVHNNSGFDLLKNSEIEYHNIRWDSFIKHNHRMVFGKNYLINDGARKQMGKAFKVCSYLEILEEYANGASIRRPKSMVKKLYRFARGKLFYKPIINFHINKILNQK